MISYGEDALTYWALTKKLDLILEQLNDESNTEDCILFYRPSFGRRGGNKRAEFGEFDSILATPKTVFLIESKWGGSSELKNGTIALRFEQIERHEIF